MAKLNKITGLNEAFTHMTHSLAKSLSSESVCLEAIAFHKDPHAFKAAQQFFKRHRQAQPGKNDRVLLIRHTSDRGTVTIGGVWMQLHTHAIPIKKVESESDNPSADVLWIRSLYVCPEFRHQGLGKRLLQRISKMAYPHPSVAFVKPDLCDWYKQCGFTPVTDLSTLPDSLSCRLDHYLEHQTLTVFLGPSPKNCSSP